MKISEIAVDGLGVCCDVHLSNLKKGLNVVYGANGSGKTTLRDFLKALLYGFGAELRWRYLLDTATRVEGHAVICDGSSEYRVQRSSSAGPGQLIIESSARRADAGGVMNRWLNGLDPSAYEAFFSVGFRDLVHGPGLITLLKTRFGLQPGADRWLGERGRNGERPERRELLEALRQDVTTLTDRERRLRAKMEQQDSARRSRLRDLVQRIENLGMEIDRHVHRLDQLKVQRSQLDSQMRRQPSPAETPPRCMDQQVQCWRNLQLAVFSLRVQLRDVHEAQTRAGASPQTGTAMLKQWWAEFDCQLERVRTAAAAMTAEAAGLLPDSRAIEACSRMLDECENTRRAALEALQPLTPADQPWKAQAVAEALKCLRTWYQRLGANVEFWMQQQGRVDSQAGCTATDPAESLAQRCDQLNGSIAQLRLQIEKLEVSRAALQQKRSVLEGMDSEQEVKESWQTLRAQLDRKSRQVSELTLPETKPAASDREFLQDTCRFLARMTDGQLVQVWLGIGSELCVRDRHGVQLPMRQLSRGNQDQVYLSLCLAAAAAYARKGIWMPLVLDDLFINIDGLRRLRTIEVLADFCRQGHQIVLLTCHRDVIGGLQSYQAAVFELPDPEITRPFWPEIELPSEYEVQRERAQLLSPTLEQIVEGDVSWPDTWPQSTWRPHLPMPSHRALRRRETKKQMGFHEHSLLREVDLVPVADLWAMVHCGIHDVGDLLDVQPQAMLGDLQVRGITAEQIRSWQVQAELRICLPQLIAGDARVLAACGVCSPADIVDMGVDPLTQVVDKYLSAQRDRQLDAVRSRYDRQRVAVWVAAAEAYLQVDAPSEDLYESDVATELETPARFEPLVSETTATPTFHLNTDDLLQSAPSIGAKTADRFRQVGMATVGELLSQQPEKVARKLGVKRISAETVRQWQQQMRLMVRVPNLRSHDAQLLVACGLKDAEDVASMAPKKLYSLVKAMMESKKGQRILRNASRPGLGEVTNWIDWARHNRALQAA